MTNHPMTIYHAAAAVKPDGQTFRPGVLASRDDHPVWLGPAAQVPEDIAACANHVDIRRCLILPGMVNAHTHLELNDVGPRPYPGGFIRWMVRLREQWIAQSQQSLADDEQARHFAEAAKRGAQASLNAGVTAVGDISRFGQIAHARREAGLGGVTFEEMFGVGPPWDEPGLRAIQSEAGVLETEGFQPHAPYSAGPRLYEAAARAAQPVSTHLAEMPEELRFVSRGDGPWLKFLNGIGKWDQAFASRYGQGLTPVQWMQPYLELAARRNKPWLLAHCNYVTDRDIRILADTNTSVAYCPRASEYFVHPQPEAPARYQPPPGQYHRYQQMLNNRVNVCLGTDSIVCQPPDEPQPMSILAQMRMLYRRDRIDPRVLLEMATTNGKRALHLADERDASIGPPFYQVHINPNDPTDPLTQALQNDKPINPLWNQAAAR